MTSKSEELNDREIVLSRVFDAPRELVWKAWTETEHLSRWWGPRGFTTTTHSRELKPGGVWRFVMHGPDGRDYDNIMTFLEVVAPERLSYKHGGENDCEPVNFHVTVTFESVGEQGKMTKLTMRSIFPSAKARDFVIREYHAVEGGKQTLERLGEHLQAMGGDSAEESPGNSNFVITRVFRIPRDQMWSLWTERDHLMKWFGPQGVSVPQCSLDLRPGGVFHYCLRGADGKDMWNKWTFREIKKPERLVFLVSFSNAEGSVERAFFDPTWPLEMLSVVTFAEHAGIGHGTVVRVEWSPFNATDAERSTFMAGLDGMNQGWTGTLEKLDAYVGERKLE